MNKEVEKKYVKAGRIAAEVREASRKILKMDKKLIDIAEEIEALIKEKGAEPAFPVNISINDIAAHYTPTKNSEETIKEGDMVKIDVGVHIDGYVGDTAVTVNFSKDHDDFVKAAESALNEAVKLARDNKKFWLKARDKTYRAWNKQV